MYDSLEILSYKQVYLQSLQSFQNNDAMIFLEADRVGQQLSLRGRIFFLTVTSCKQKMLYPHFLLLQAGQSLIMHVTGPLYNIYHREHGY